MKTLRPALLHGYSEWERDKLPLDEFEERIRTARQRMAREGLDALIAYGDISEYSRVCYFSNFVPKSRWCIVLISHVGSPRLLVAMGGTRDLPANKLLTWIEDMETGSDLEEKLAHWLDEVRSNGDSNASEVRVGLAGEAVMRARVHQSVMKACEGYRVISADGLLEDLMLIKRPREIAVLRDTCRILEEATRAISSAHANGEPVAQAVVEGERVARRSGAHDTRILFSLDGGRTLQPFEDVDETRSDPLACYLAIEYLGYWAEGFLTLTQTERPIDRYAKDVLQYLLEHATPGATAAGLVLDAESLRGPYDFHLALEGVLGHGIGLSLEEMPIIYRKATGTVRAGNVLSLRIGLTDSNAEHTFASAIVSVHGQGNQVLWMSPNPVS